jgi:hypothetical protein
VKKTLKIHWKPALLALIVGASILYLFDRRAPVEIIAPDAISAMAPGESRYVGFTIDWRRLCRAEVYRDREWEPSGEIDHYRSVPLNPPDQTGIEEDRHLPVHVPKKAEGNSVMTIHATGYFSCNALQDIWPIKVKFPPIRVPIQTG